MNYLIFFSLCILFVIFLGLSFVALFYLAHGIYELWKTFKGDIV